MAPANRAEACARFLVRARRGGTLAFALVALGACGSSSTPSSVPDAGPTSTSDSSTEGAEGAAGCSTLPNTAPSVLVRCDSAAGPVPAGGSLSDGTYYLTDTAVLHGGSSGTCPNPPLTNRTSKTIRVTGGIFESVEPTGTGAAHYQASWVTSGTTITFTTLCETQQSVHLATFSKEYTATASELVLLSRGSTSSIETYTKQ